MTAQQLPAALLNAGIAISVGATVLSLGVTFTASLKAAQLAKRADLPLAVSVVVVLQLVNIIAVPVWAGQVVTGASISAWDIVKACSRWPSRSGIEPERSRRRQSRGPRLPNC